MCMVKIMTGFDWYNYGIYVRIKCKEQNITIIII